MLRRRLLLESSIPDAHGKSVYVLDGSGEIEESDIANEFLGLVVKHNPGLDSKTGRLLPGFKLAETYDVSPEIVLSVPDRNGVSHIEGIKIPQACKSAVLANLEALGYEINESEA